MKILMTTDTVGGVWTYALELARSLREHGGVQIALATMGAPGSQQQARQAARLDNVTLHPSTYKLEWMHDPWADVDRAGRWLLELEAISAGRCSSQRLQPGDLAFRGAGGRRGTLVLLVMVAGRER